MPTVPEAAARLGLAASTLRVQIRNGKLRARKIGRDWQVSEREIERYRAESRGKHQPSCDHPGIAVDGRCLYCKAFVGNPYAKNPAHRPS